MTAAAVLTALRALAILAAVTGSAAAETRSEVGENTVYQIKPSEADPAVASFDEPNFVVLNRKLSASAQLVLFLPGTSGRPGHTMNLFKVVAGNGYRVIGLMYDNEPSVVSLCPQNPDPACSANFRQKRIFGGDAPAVIDNRPNEAIVPRLVNLLKFLESRHAGEGWGAYLKGGAPDWKRIVISGLSQGAGMAAFIAQRFEVARVVLFSSPWDFQKPARTLAPWLAGPSATPAERWFAAYHAREETAGLLAQAYRMLRVPDGNIRVFNLDLAAGSTRAGADNPFHASVVLNGGYAAEWRTLFGRPS